MGLTSILGGFVLSLVISLMFTWLAIIIGYRMGIIDKPDGFRKVQDHPVPRVGGVALYLSIIIPALVLLLFFPEIPITVILADNLQMLVMCFLGAGLIMGLGLLDDIYDLKPIIKVAGQVAVASFMYFAGFKIVAVINPLNGGNIYLGFLEFPATVLWFLVCMNIVNLLDGIDGLAAGACLFVGITLFFLSLHMGNNVGMFTMACFTGAILGFLLFNFPPASIYLGDSGSLVLGFFIASMTLLGGIRKADAAVALLIPVVALGLPLLDTSLAIVRRWYKKLPVSSSDKMHIHHRLVKGLGYTRALLTLYAICVVLLMAALLITFGSNEIVLIVLIILTFVVFVCFRFFSGLKFSDIITRVTTDGVRKDLRAESMAKVYRTIEMMQNAGDNNAIWVLCEDLFKELDIGKVVLNVGGNKYIYEHDDSHDTADPDGECMIRFPLRIGDGAPSEIVFSKTLSKSKYSPIDAEMLMIIRAGLEKYFTGIPLKKEGIIQG